MPIPPFSLSCASSAGSPQPINGLIALALADPQIISLAAGLVDYDTLPVALVERHLAAILKNHGPAALQYGTTEGMPRLRRAIFNHLAKQEDAAGHNLENCSPDEVVVTTGSQQLLHLLAEVLLNPGDIVVTCWPSYFVYTQALSAFGALPRSVEMDEDGMIPEKLEALLEQLRREGQLANVKMLYLVTYHQNPTGITLCAARKAKILDLVKKYSALAGQRILILEDAAYRELAFGNDADATPPSFRAFDTEGEYSAIAQTFSKPFAPGIKTGYGLLPKALVGPVKQAKGGHDFGSANLCHFLLASALESGDFDRHVQTLKAAYAAKGKAVVDALQESFACVPGASWSHPKGGMYVWLTLPAGTDTGPDSPLWHAAVAEKMIYVPGCFCYPKDPTRTVPTNTLRLAYGVTSPEQAREGIRRLARAWGKMAAK